MKRLTRRRPSIPVTPNGYYSRKTERDLENIKKHAEAVMAIMDMAPRHVRLACHEHNDERTVKVWYEAQQRRIAREQLQQTIDRARRGSRQLPWDEL